MAESTFMTPARTNFSNQLWSVTAAIGAGLCFLVLCIIMVVWLHPKSRPHLDRVSWRIVVWALVTNLIFAIANTVGGKLTEDSGFLCGFSVFILQLSLQFSSFLLFTIALNLQLVVVHNFSGQRLEKYYIIVSAVMAVILVVPPYATGLYGWDPLEQDCWYTSDNTKTRLIWQITTQSLWTALTALGEITTSICVMAWMLRHNHRIRHIFVKFSSSPRHSANDMAPQLIRSIDYRKIVLRISLYPLASCFVNLLSVVTVLHSTASGGIHNQTDYNILLLSDFLYGGRAIVYALLAGCDPALVRATQTLLTHLMHQYRDGAEGVPSSSSGSYKIEFGPMSSRSSRCSRNPIIGSSPPPGPIVHIELSTTVHRDTDTMNSPTSESHRSRYDHNDSGNEENPSRKATVTNLNCEEAPKDALKNSMDIADMNNTQFENVGQQQVPTTSDLDSERGVDIVNSDHASINAANSGQRDSGLLRRETTLRRRREKDDGIWKHI